MNAFRSRIAALPFLVLGATVAMGTSGASAQNFFERLFGAHRYERGERYDTMRDRGRYSPGDYRPGDYREEPVAQPQTPRATEIIMGELVHPQTAVQLGSGGAAIVMDIAGEGFVQGVLAVGMASAELRGAGGPRVR